MKGNLLVIAAPSGAGKTSLVQELLRADASLRVSISHTTRAARPGEINGQHYHFTNTEHFQAMLSEQAFFESALVHGNYYGTSRARVMAELAAENDVILEIDWQGAQQIRAAFPQVRSIFILPPSKQTLLTRLRNRGQDSETVIAKRVANAREEMSHAHEFDYIVVNDRFDQALLELSTIIAACRLSSAIQQQRHAGLIAKLLDAN
jgi:guanylate kinase